MKTALKISHHNFTGTVISFGGMFKVSINGENPYGLFTSIDKAEAYISEEWSMIDRLGYRGCLERIMRQHKNGLLSLADVKAKIARYAVIDLNEYSDFDSFTTIMFTLLDSGVMDYATFSNYMDSASEKFGEDWH